MHILYDSGKYVFVVQPDGQGAFEVGGVNLDAPPSPVAVDDGGCTNIFAIGDIGPGGFGIVFQVSNGGCNGLVVAELNLADSNWNTAMTTAMNLMVGGFSDWFLPSKDQLNALYGQKAVVEPILGVFANGVYWTSTEIDVFNAWIQHLFTGTPSPAVRALRAKRARFGLFNTLTIVFARAAGNIKTNTADECFATCPTGVIQRIQYGGAVLEALRPSNEDSPFPADCALS